MPVIQSSLLYVVKRFPSHKESILQLFRKNQNFRTICDDYRCCSEALERWGQSASEDAPALTKEYTELLLDLELEVLQYLNELT